jgi:enediyne biosynthesis protein E4
MNRSENRIDLWAFGAVAIAVCLAALLLGGRQESAPIPSVRPVPTVSPPPAEVPALPATPQTKPSPDFKADSQRRASVPERVALDKTLWAPEILAQRHEEVFIGLWDRLRKSKSPLTVIRQFPLTHITFKKPGPIMSLTHGVTVRRLDQTETRWSADEFRGWLENLKNSGFTLVQSEWHHSKFEPGRSDGHRSLFSIGLHLRQKNRRYAVKGTIRVDWDEKLSPDDTPLPNEIVVTDMTVTERVGKPAFTEVSLPMARTSRAMPLLVYDLNGDGLAEIVLPFEATVLKNKGAMKFEAGKIPYFPPPEAPPELIDRAQGSTIAAVIGDFTQDGRPDLMLAMRKLGLYLYESDGNGQFNSPPVRVFSEADSFVKPFVMSAGDVNGDGRLDLWLAQYKEPYRTGQMPDPMFDANDGFPAYLLLNRGNHRYEDVTLAAGLGAKRNRRTFSGSLWDADEDGDLDLIVVSDFSGVDLYENYGEGHFKDITEQAFDERANFGMGHSFADFNADGHMDLYVTGMSSTTARRLEALGLKRDGFPAVNDQRMAMAYGNRLYLGNGKGQFRQPDYKDSVARSGWSWGVSHFDFGNDGRLDFYVANGHRSGETCKDYCTRFWTHDVYVAKTDSQEKLLKVFDLELNEWSDTSWNGYEKNHFFINSGGDRYSNAAFPLDVAFEYDSRTVVSEDFDGDGRVDLLVTQDLGEGGNYRPHLYRNTWTENGNWIGIRLRPGKKVTEAGARIGIAVGGQMRHEVIVTGDSLAAQHSASRHFGLGNTNKVDAIQIRWPNGKETRIPNPAINQWHTIKAPE